MFLNLSGRSLDKLKSDAQVTIPVEVKFVNRTRHAVQLEWITPQGRREKKKVLAKGRCWRTTSWEGHYWVCCDPKHDEHLFALNYGLHYRVQKTRGARERIVITAGNMFHLSFCQFLMLVLILCNPDLPWSDLMSGVLR